MRSSINKRIIIGVICSLLAGSLILAGCGKKKAEEVKEPETPAVEEQVKPEAEAVTVVAKPAEEVKEDTPAVDYNTIYLDILDEYYYFLESNGETTINEGGSDGVFEAIQGLEGPEPTDIVGYHIEDMDSDGIPELLIGNIEGEGNNGGYGSMIYAIYGCKDGKVDCLLEGWYRNRYSRMNGNKLFHYGSGGAAYSCFGTFHIADSSSLVAEDFYFTGMSENMEDIILYRNTTGEWDEDSSDIMDCSVEQFWDIEDKLERQIQTMPFTAFAYYKPVKSLDQANVGIDVLGNDGYFVQSGGRVYFHAPDAKDMNQTSLWSDFIFSDNGDTNLYSVGLSDDDVKLEAKDHAWGRMSKSGDFLFYNAYSNLKDEQEENLGHFELNGSKYNDSETSGEVYIGGDKAGHYAIAYTYDYKYRTSDGSQAHFLWIHKDGKLMDAVEIKGYPNPVGITDNDYIYVSTEETASGDVDYLMDLNLSTHQITNLGKLPKEDYGGYEVDQFEYDDFAVYFSYGNYDGTGHFYQCGSFVSAVIGQADSVKYEDQTRADGVDEYNDYPNISSPFRLEYGKMVPCVGIPNSAAVIEDEIGYYNKYGTWTPVASGEYRTYFKNDEETIRHYEAIELIANYIYVIEDISEHVEEDDIGWRYAYRRLETNIYRVDIRTGEKTILLNIVNK